MNILQKKLELEIQLTARLRVAGIEKVGAGLLVHVLTLDLKE